MIPNRMKNVPLTSQSPVPPNDNGAVHYRAPADVKLLTVILEPSQPTAILRVVAGGETIEADDAKPWADLLAGRVVPKDAFVIVHVANRSDEPVQVVAQIVVEDVVHDAEVVPQIPPAAQAARTDARPFYTPPQAQPSNTGAAPARPKLPGMREPGRGGGGGIMRNLGVVRHGIVDPEILAQGGPRVTGRDAENPERVIREAAAPPMTRGQVIRGPAANMPAVAGTSSVTRSATPNRIVQNVRPTLQRAGSSALPVVPAGVVPAVTATPASPNAGASPAPLAVVQQTAPQATDGRVTVRLMSGHALAVQAMLEGRRSLRPVLRNPILAALMRATPCVGEAHETTGQADIAVHLTADERTALGHMVRAGGAHHPQASAVRDAFRHVLPVVQATG